MSLSDEKRTQFATPARVKGTGEWGGAPTGVLALDGDRLVFVVPPDKIKLDTTLDQCEFSFSKWMMRQGFMIRTGGKKYGVGFAKISPFVTGQVLRAAGFEALGAAATVSGIVSTIKAPALTKQWKEVLTEAGAL